MNRMLIAPMAALVLYAPPSAPATSVGASWISIELPASPLDRTTRGAFLLVHTYHHAQVTRELVAARAIGQVDGKRREIELELDRTGTPGVLALRKAWPDGGPWVLVITLGRGERSATALVGVGGDGKVRSVDVPTQTEGDDTWPRPITDQDIEGTLAVSRRS